jgi:hypothetical protein
VIEFTDFPGGVFCLRGQVLEYLGLLCGREPIDRLQNLGELGTHGAASLLGYGYFSVVLGFGEALA